MELHINLSGVKMKSKKIDEFELENLLYSFGYQENSARFIASKLKRVDLEDFYNRFLSKFKASENSESLESMVYLISYLINQKRFIPGQSGMILSDAILQLGDFANEFIQKMKTVDSFSLKGEIIQGFHNMDGFF